MIILRQPTLCNVTIHSCLDLVGAGNGDILEYVVIINVFKVQKSNSTGVHQVETPNVKGTTSDFRAERIIGEAIDVKYEPHKIGAGYYQSLVSDKHDGEYGKGASFLILNLVACWRCSLLNQRLKRIPPII